MSTAIERAPQPEMSIALVMSDQGVYDRFKGSCAMLAAGGGEFLPKGINTVQKVQACGLLAMGMGLDPFQAMQHAFIVKGKIGFDYDYLLAIAIQRIPTLRYEITLNDATTCKGWWQRSPDHPRFEVEYSVDMAKKAGLIKDGGAWLTDPQSMCYSKWVRRGLKRAAPDTLMGLPRLPEEDPDYVETKPGAPSVDDIETKPEPKPVEASGAVVVDEPTQKPDTKADAKPIDPAKPEPENGAKLAFYSTAKEAGWNPRSSKDMYALLVELLTEEGQVPVFRSTGEVTTNDWRSATARLLAKYPNGKPEDWGAAGAGKPEAAKDAAPPAPVAQEEEEPAAVDPEAQIDKLTSTSEQQALEEQMTTYEYLLDLCRDLEKRLKAPGQYVRDTPKGPWFVNSDVLLQAGMTKEGSPVAQSKALYDGCSIPAAVLTPSEVYGLSSLVSNLLDNARNGGRQVVRTGGV